MLTQCNVLVSDLWQLLPICVCAFHYTWWHAHVVHIEECDTASVDYGRGETSKMGRCMYREINARRQRVACTECMK